MWKYVTSLLLVFVTSISIAQTATGSAVANDTITYEKTYGLRLGLDLASIARTALDEEYTGFQIMADFRLTDDWYIAGELGTESLDRETNQVDFETSGSFLKAGADYNFYNNWQDLDNMLYSGFRVGASNFSTTLDRFDYYQDNDFFPVDSQISGNKTDGLLAIWAEVQAGIKVEVLNNLYMGINVQLKVMVSEDEPDGFGNLYVPGFGRTYDTNSIGVGYSYGISYRIPFYKK
ncbi:DUF6048 family protein [Nonlabens marinus]|uniref:Outer membrane protein beta-barrel domain-containing protein n=1 Tax=Nonlabens marinus S1-08 TaxID=1454201 RepID=W8VQC5_9FLAO|nr:DUF6048 family protein [Nonlabens marinus]BAO55594.1 hypothetical protein NMS_1585 [Nonlabens marinus S1-08]